MLSLWKHEEDYGFRELTKGTKSSILLCRFLFDSMRKVITRRRSEQVTGIMSEEPRLGTSDNPFKIGLLVVRQSRQKSFEFYIFSLFWTTDRASGTQRR
jgi:hypothetical protein